MFIFFWNSLWKDAFKTLPYFISDIFKVFQTFPGDWPYLGLHLNEGWVPIELFINMKLVLFQEDPISKIWKSILFILKYTICKVRSYFLFYVQLIRNTKCRKIVKFWLVVTFRWQSWRSGSLAPSLSSRSGTTYSLVPSLPPLFCNGYKID